MPRHGFLCDDHACRIKYVTVRVPVGQVISDYRKKRGLHLGLVLNHEIRDLPPIDLDADPHTILRTQDVDVLRPCHSPTFAHRRHRHNRCIDPLAYRPHLAEGEWRFEDSHGHVEYGGTRLGPVSVVRAGRVYPCTPARMFIDAMSNEACDDRRWIRRTDNV
jgi:hypothetical protein